MMRSVKILGWDSMTSTEAVPGQGTAFIAPLGEPCLIVVTEGECTVGNEVKLDRETAVLASAGEILNLRQVTPKLELIRIVFDHAEVL